MIKQVYKNQCDHGTVLHIGYITDSKLVMHDARLFINKFDGLAICLHCNGKCMIYHDPEDVLQLISEVEQ